MQAKARLACWLSDVRESRCFMFYCNMLPLSGLIEVAIHHSLYIVDLLGAAFGTGRLHILSALMG